MFSDKIKQNIMHQNISLRMEKIEGFCLVGPMTPQMLLMIDD